MKFQLVDHILEQSEDRILAIKQVSRAEEYLADHFPGFPILPGVMMVETMVHAARALLADRSEEPLVLGSVKAVKFGAMVRPGEALEVEITLGKANDDGSFDCRGTGRVRRHATVEGGEKPAGAETAVSGRFTMRPVRRDP